LTASKCGDSNDEDDTTAADSIRLMSRKSMMWRKKDDVEGDHTIIPLQGQWVFALIIQSIGAVCYQCYHRMDPLAGEGNSF
jgi:hypothetical protein